MNKDTIERLTKVAAMLPDIFEERYTDIKGSELKNMPMFNYKERKIRDNKTYSIPRQFPVDHLDRLKDAYRKNGDAGVDAYVKWANAQSAQLKKTIQKKPKVSVL